MARLTLCDLTFCGQSAAGLGTAIAIKELKLCFDIGHLSDPILAASNVFVSHGHTDHIGELPNYLAIRALQHRNLATIFLPASISDDVRDTLHRWQKFSSTRFDFRIVDLYPDGTIPLTNGLSVTPFALDHVVDTFGFLVSRSVTKLSATYSNLPGDEIKALKQKGTTDLFYTSTRPLAAYLPDTLPAGLDNAPEAVWEAPVLLVEASFLDDSKPLEKVRKGKHLVLADLVQRLPRFRGQHVLLFHFSKLYNECDIGPLVAKQIPDPWKERIHCFL